MFEFLTQAQHEMSSRLAESTFLFPTYLGRSKETLLAGYKSSEEFMKHMSKDLFALSKAYSHKQHQKDNICSVE